ncbi:MAG: ABC transporter ATP-binding protein [Pirellulales bacterium]|nr:ABC transporter ATP-binding protein [Pirellulales bacterium]
MIQLDHIAKVYPRADGLVHALVGVNLEVPRGRFVAIRGPSGCGKSTLLSIVGALGSPTSGRAVVAGEDLAALSPGGKARFRARTIGFVFQMFHLLPYLTVLENVVAAVSPEHRADGVRRAVELLSRFGLARRRGHRPAELSAGERQRTAIARAMVNQPAVLLADEPTGNLDPDNASEVMAILADYHRQGGTVLLVTHDEAATAVAQQVILMRDGAIEDAART